VTQRFFDKEWIALSFAQDCTYKLFASLEVAVGGSKRALRRRHHRLGALDAAREPPPVLAGGDDLAATRGRLSSSTSV
jgi:hypothetical protein